MLWLLLFHIITLTLWCAALLYLPVLIAGVKNGHAGMLRSASRHDSVARFAFTHVATPIALLAIVSGTLVFLLTRTVEIWLVAKLTLVTGLVVGHALAGILLLRAEDEDGGPVHPWWWLLEIALFGLIGAILWIVLAKPAPELLPWTL